MRDAKIPLASAGELARHTTSRRDFLRLAGLGGAALLLPAAVTACSESPLDPRIGADIDLSTDEGVQRFAYVLTQFKKGFIDWISPYNPYPGITLLENATFRGIWDHMRSYKSYFYNTVDPDFPDQIYFRFDGVDLSRRSSVFPFAIEVCEIAAATFPALVAYAKTPKTATMLAKISSVSARHVAALRDLQDIHDGRASSSGRVSFAASDVVSSTTGLNQIMTPREALDRFGKYITTNHVTLRGA